MQGSSLVPFLRGESSSDWGDAQFYTYWGVLRHYGIRTDRYTYLKLEDNPSERFDRESDPNQLLNIAGNPEHASLIVRLERELQKQIAEVDISDEELPVGGTADGGRQSLE